MEHREKDPNIGGEDMDSMVQHLDNEGTSPNKATLSTPYRITEVRIEALHKIIKEKDREISSMMQINTNLKSQL
jgi:hypothetical protein